MNFYQIYRRVLKSWFIDFILFFIVLIGALAVIFRQEVYDFVTLMLGQVSEAMDEYNKANQGKPGITDHLTIKNVAIGLIAVAFLVVFWNRIVWRMRNSKRLTAAVCPKCSHPLSRIRRTSVHKGLSAILPVRRFYCHNCHWKGIRVKSFTSDDHVGDIKIKSAASRNLSSV